MSSSCNTTEYRKCLALVGSACTTTGPAGPAGPQGPYAPRGNTAVVDAVYGNDSTASIGGSPFLTVAAAVAAVSSGQTVWILPGTYTLASGLVLPNGISLRGMSLQTCIIQMNVTSSTTLLTMGEQCRVEDLTLNLTCTGSTAGVVLKGIVFGGTSSQTSKLRVCVVNVNNALMSKTLTNTVTGIEFSGTGSLTASVFSFNSIKGSTINVYSNGAGNKRGLLVSNSNQASTRDVNVYVAQPPDTDSTGSYVGVETNDPGNTGSIQLRTTTSGVVVPTGTQAYTASDILQTTPATITNPTYLSSAGIQIGPGTDLVTKSAGNKGFSTYVYPTIVYYGLKGNITSGPSGGYLWPGTQTVSAGQYPDTGLPAAFFRAQQPTLISGLSCSLNAAPGGTNTVTLSAYYIPKLTTNTTGAVFTGYISGTTLTVSTGPSSGAIAIGQTVSGSGVAINTYIVSGSGSTWTVYPSQTVASSGSPITITNGTPSSTFTGSISGTTLTVASLTSGAVAIGQYVAGSTVTAGTNITAQLSPTTWTVSATQTVGSATLYTNGMLATPFTVTFGPSDTEKTFYNASVRLDTGDRIMLYTSYTTGGGGANAAHDITAQIDLF